MSDEKYHLLSPDEAYSAVGGTDKSTEQWVSQQREKYGSNKLAEAEGRSLLSVVLSNFINPITAILGAVLVLACILEEWIEAVVVVLVILLNNTISIIQEYKSEKSMDAIKHLGGATNATVVREGRGQQIPLSEVVVGDIVELKQGDVVPADLRMMELSRLEIDEAVLTGESVPVIKTLPAIPHPEEKDQDVAVGDRTNMAFRQTSVSQGSGRGVVVFVGDKTEIGKIAARLADGSSTDKKTALTATMERLMYGLFFVGIIFGVFIFWAFEWQISDQALLYASATLVAILPEAAIVLITVTMAISVRRMAASNAIVRKMTALEQLGKVTDICSDKTGTLTEGKMRPARLVVCSPDGTPMEELIPEGPANSRKATWSTPLTSLAADAMETLSDSLRALVLCSSTSMVLLDSSSDDLEGHGSPTELALMETAWKVSYGLRDTIPNLDAVRAGWQARGTFDFDSKTKTMSTGWHNASTGTSLCTVKGAPESVLPRCSGDPMNNPQLVRTMDELASQGLRVLAVAQRTDLSLSDSSADVASFERADVETNLRFLALCAVRDPPKQSSITAVTQCFSAGIIVRMLTGDHPATAEAIAKEIGIIPDGPAGKGVVTTGPKMDVMTDAELDQMPELPLIVARCSPESKVRMVEALHRRGKVAAMTGDGVNDSPSIKEADVGIAMGITGSDVTKGVADIVLADDNFATIVSAVREGRRIFASISNFVMHLLSGNMAEAVVLLVSLAFVIDDNGFPIFVLSPIAILFINTATGSGPAIGIALDDCASDLMKRPPVKHSIFTKETIMDCMFYGTVMGGMSLAAFSIYFWVIADANFGVNCNTNEGTDCDTVLEARASSFLALNTLLLAHAYNCRHQRKPFWRSPLNNKVLYGSLIGGTLICVVLLYVPYLSTKVFKHKGGAWEWVMVACLLVAFMLVCETYKLIKRTFLPPLTTYVGDSKLGSVKVEAAKPMV
eukprot:CAMPEP_0177777534 /NCGR_PEP_ID=MMETSP0491_2-20121128/15422_1 /TAXON_ID=63592 /ORGANISM="Tetraselmis chuii, Strain PLY429" /LENGTH=961 /DNA_ID=CAMNT_0019296647 /DNA_START=135 /DNA_END=3020 /DNA_ORIENTATION=+